MQSVHLFLLVFFDRKKFVGEFILQALRRPRVLVLIDFLVSLFGIFKQQLRPLTSMSHSLKKWSSNFETTNAEKLHRLFSLHYDASEKARLLARPPHVCHMSGSFNMHHVLQVNVSRGLVYVSLSKPTCRDEVARCACKCITCKSTKKNPKTRNIGIKIRESM